MVGEEEGGARVGKVAPYLTGPEEVPGRASLIGTDAPPFQLLDEEGKHVSLRSLNRNRPLLRHLYRGQW